MKVGDLVLLKDKFVMREGLFPGIVICIYGPTGKFPDTWATVLWSNSRPDDRNDTEEIWCKNLEVINESR